MNSAAQSAITCDNYPAVLCKEKLGFFNGEKSSVWDILGPMFVRVCEQQLYIWVDLSNIETLNLPPTNIVTSPFVHTGGLESTDTDT